MGSMFILIIIIYYLFETYNVNIRRKPSTVLSTLHASHTPRLQHLIMRATLKGEHYFY